MADRERENLLTGYQMRRMKYHEVTLMTDSAILAKCLEHAIHILQFVEGKENLFALAKVVLCGLFLGAW